MLGMEPSGTLCSSIWASTAARMRLGGGATFRLCSASVSQLMKSWREFWKSVARANASSSFACGSGEGEKERKKHSAEGESSDPQTEAAFVSLQQEPHRPGPGTRPACQGEGAAVKATAFSVNKNGP